MGTTLLTTAVCCVQVKTYACYFFFIHLVSVVHIRPWRIILPITLYSSALNCSDYASKIAQFINGQDMWCTHLADSYNAHCYDYALDCSSLCKHMLLCFHTTIWLNCT